MQHIFVVGRLSTIRNAYLLRGAGTWVCARLAIAFGEVVDPRVAAEIAILLVVAFVVWSDARRRGEDLLLGNLGVPSWTIAVLALPVAVLAELLVP